MLQWNRHDYMFTELLEGQNSLSIISLKLSLDACLTCSLIMRFIIWPAPWAGKMELSCQLGTTRRVQREKIPLKPNNISFIDQAFRVKMAGYWPPFFASLWTLTSRSINTQKKELGQYPAILTSRLVNNLYILIKSTCSRFAMVQ